MSTDSAQIATGTTASNQAAPGPAPSGDPSADRSAAGWDGEWDERSERVWTGEDLDAAPPATPPLTPQERQRDAYGGLSVGAAFHGWLSALGTMVLLLLAVATVGLVLGLAQDVSSGTGQLVIGQTTVMTVLTVVAVVAVLGCFSGSYAAGRLVRFDGARQGFGVWVLLVVTALVGLGLAVTAEAQYALTSRPSFPDVTVARADLLPVAAITVAVAAVLSLLVALGGGRLGLRYHAKVEKAGLDSAPAEDATETGGATA
ncbi:hypothetical protein GCM10009821_08760 [Aeromicrobium halocynthiae]|uniref:Major facilitator superfamily (MFS) profile domain-containing protein n=1 Tax=Aeromicrobium halocynthiae TaxID=560557 RepID=A0ABN2VU20_9ACTN